MTATIATTDLLVAVADPRVTAAIAMADEVYRAGCYAAEAEQAWEDAQADPGCSSRRVKTLNKARIQAGNRVAEVSAVFERLMVAADEDLYARVEELVCGTGRPSTRTPVRSLGGRRGQRR